MKRIILIIALVFLSACSVQEIDESFEDDYIKYENGILEYKIEITKPTPCYEIKKEEIIMESYPVQIIIDINLVEPSPEIICIQVIEEELVEGRMEIGHKPGSFTIKLNNEVLHSTNLENG